jgi:hypothetical protein
MKRKIELICGTSESNPDFEAIDSSSNFVFTPNPDFPPVRLFDLDGNVVFLNSWIECAYYVRGGWTNNVSDFIDGEKILFFLIAGLFVVFRFFKDKVYTR